MGGAAGLLAWRHSRRAGPGSTMRESRPPLRQEPTVSIVVEDYHKAYDQTVAVAGISFTGGPGESLGLVGPNGAGKTTTMRALAGILTPTRGRLAVAGHDLQREPVAAKAALAYVPDDPKLFDALTVWEHFR